MEEGGEEGVAPKKGRGAKKRGRSTKGAAKGKGRAPARPTKREEQSSSEAEGKEAAEPEAKKARAEEGEVAGVGAQGAPEVAMGEAQQGGPPAEEGPELFEPEAPVESGVDLRELEREEEQHPAPGLEAEAPAEGEQPREPEAEGEPWQLAPGTAAEEKEAPEGAYMGREEETRGPEGGMEEGMPIQGQIQETQQEEEEPRPAAPAEGEAQPAEAHPETQHQQKSATGAPTGADTVEQGRIIFLYRPKVGLEEASSISQVQRFYMILVPEGTGKRPRLAVVGKKRLPTVDSHERFFGFIEAVGDSVESLTEGLGPKSYETKTRGTRQVAAARVVGEGTYAIMNRGGSGAAAGRTHLVFHLLVPAQPGEVQEDFAIPQEGSYVFSVKNPGNEPFQGAGGPAIGLEEKAEYEPENKREFGGYAWIGVTDPSVS